MTMNALWTICWISSTDATMAGGRARVWVPADVVHANEMGVPSPRCPHGGRLPRLGSGFPLFPDGCYLSLPQRASPRYFDMLLTPRLLRARKAARTDAASSSSSQIPPSNSTSPSSPVPIIDTPVVDHTPEDSDSSASRSSYNFQVTHDAESNQLSTVDPPDADECLAEVEHARHLCVLPRANAIVTSSVAWPTSG